MAEPQRHLDALSALDTAFLRQEDHAGTHTHIGSVGVFRGPPPGHDEFLAHARARLARIPRYRQKLAYPPAGLGRPRWIDDPTFNLDYHVRIARLPEPGSYEQLRGLAARLFSLRLDRGKPLWELLLIEGLMDNRFALLAKTHHAVVDGVSGMDITTAIFDSDPQQGGDMEAEPWVAKPEPSPAELAAHALNGSAHDVARMPLRLLGSVADRTRLRRAADDVAGAARGIVRPSPASPLDARIGPHRRVAFADAPLEDLRTVKQAFGGAVNDVVIAITAGAVRTWMHARGLPTAEHELRVAVPVSTRDADAHGELGNRITQLIAPLPVDVGDPVARLRLVQEAMAGLKDSHRAVGAEVIAGSQDFAPPTILAQSMRVSFSPRSYDLLLTNIPGPQLPLYLMGRELERIHPLAFLDAGRALAVAAMSYNGNVGFGLIADYDAMPDLDVLAAALVSGLAELTALARRRGARAAR